MNLALIFCFIGLSLTQFIQEGSRVFIYKSINLVPFQTCIDVQLSTASAYFNLLKSHGQIATINEDLNLLKTELYQISLEFESLKEKFVKSRSDEALVCNNIIKLDRYIVTHLASLILGLKYTNRDVAMDNIFYNGLSAIAQTFLKNFKGATDLVTQENEFSFLQNILPPEGEKEITLQANCFRQEPSKIACKGSKIRWGERSPAREIHLIVPGKCTLDRGLYRDNKGGGIHYHDLIYGKRVKNPKIDKCLTSIQDQNFKDLKRECTFKAETQKIRIYQQKVFVWQSEKIEFTSSKDNLEKVYLEDKGFCETPEFFFNKKHLIQDSLVAIITFLLLTGVLLYICYRRQVRRLRALRRQGGDIGLHPLNALVRRQ